MEEFTISTGRDWIQLSLDEVYGFPHKTSHFGGYDVRGDVVIACHAYHVHHAVWFSTGQIWEFYTALHKAWEELAGEARFRSSEGELDFTIRFDPPGGMWTLEGDYKASHYDLTTLHFAMDSDQSYLNEPLKELAVIVATYGDNRGIHR